MRAVVYARVSSAQQRDRETIASQLRVLPAFVERQGWELVREATTYVDDGRSAKAGQLDKRAGFAALLRDAATGAFDVVVVVDIDRISRSEDLAERGAIFGALQRAGVKVASAVTGQVLDLSTSSGDLFTSLGAFFAAEWTRKHRERVMQGRITGIQRGRKPAGKLPFGLAYDRASGAWSLDEPRAAVVREIFERVAAGESGRAIADDLHRRGAPAPRGEWERSRIARLIRNRYAVGEWTVDRTRGLVLQVPPMIDDGLWHRAQAAIAETGRRGLRRTRHEYLLEGLAVCACGAPIGIRSRQWDPRRNGRHSPATYICRGRLIYRLNGSRCDAPIQRVEDADARVWAAIARELVDPDLAAEIGREIDGQAGERDAWTSDADGYRAHLTRLERVEAGVLDRYRRGMISDGAFDTELARLTRERDALRSQLATAEKARAVALDTQTRLDDAMRTLDELRAALVDSAFAVRRQLVELLVPRGGIVFDGEALKVTLLVPRSSEARRGRALVVTSVSNTRHESHLRIRVVA